MKKYILTGFALVIIFLLAVSTGYASFLAKTFHFTPEVSKRSPKENALRKAFSVCPPFFLRDESGVIIDPVHSKNGDRPYSPRKTCGACHNYKLITSAFHFQQGRGEPVPEWQKDRYPWVSSPGQYGGRW